MDRDGATVPACFVLGLYTRSVLGRFALLFNTPSPHTSPPAPNPLTRSTSISEVPGTAPAFWFEITNRFLLQTSIAHQRTIL